MNHCAAFLIALCLSLGSLAVPSSAARADEAEYNSIVKNALAEFDAGHFEEAAALFERAHAQSPSARTHRGLGLAYFEGRRYTLAVRHLRAALEDKRRALTGDQRKSAEDVLKRAEDFVAHYKVTLSPAATTLTIDGNAPDLEADELLLDAGRHELIARAPGYADDRRILDAIAGAKSDLQITLSMPQGGAAVAANTSEVAPPPTAADTTSAPAGATAASKSSGPGIAPFIVMGVGGAVTIAGVVTGIMASSLHSDLEKRCKTGCTAKKDQDDIDSGKTLVVATNVLLIGGLVTVAAGATWWLLSPKGEREPSDTQVGAACLPGMCAASVSGRF